MEAYAALLLLPPTHSSVAKPVVPKTTGLRCQKINNVNNYISGKFVVEQGREKNRPIG